MVREDHQPSTGPVERVEHSREEMLSLCGQTIAFIMAIDPRDENAEGDGRSDASAAIKAARHAQMAAVFPMAGPGRTQDVLDAVRTSGHGGRTFVQAIEYDPSAAVDSTRDAADFELFNLPYGLIETMREVAEAVLDTYEAIVIMDAAQNKVTAEHLYELCRDAREHDVDVVVSWIQRLRRPPVVLTRDFLEQLADAAYTQPATDDAPVRCAPRIRTFDHVFGEEELAAPIVTPVAVESFLGKCSLSALEAVKIARQKQSQDVSAFSPASLNNADALLVQTAEQVIARGDALSSREAAEIEWADAFGEKCLKDFPLLTAPEYEGKLAYLDSAATSQRVQVALRAQNEFDTRGNANVYRGAYPLSTQATEALNQARERLAAFIGAEPQQVAFTANTTAAANLVALAWGEHNISSGDLIVCSRADHHSNMLPFIMLAQRKGATVEHIPFDAMGRLDQEAYAALLAKGPKLVCLAHIGNVFGIEAPVKAMADAAHGTGARVLVDAAQSFPHVRINVRELGADWIAVSAHKAYGPLGIGALWISPDAFGEMDPLCGGGGTVSHVSEQSYYLRPHALQYEPGTPPISQAIGWAAAIDYLDGLGAGNVARHDAAFTRYAARGLQSIDGVNVVGDHTQPDGQNGLVSFTVRSVTPAGIARFLGRLGVAIRSGGHCALPLHAALGMIGTGRISIAVHTTRDDIDAALTALAVCRQAYES